MWSSSETSKRERKRYCNLKERKAIRKNNREKRERRADAQETRADLIWIVPHKPGCLLLHWPPHEIIFILYESKGSPVENERLHKPEPKPSEWERGRSLLQGPCCYSKHLPLCGRPSRPIVVQKLVVLPLAPFGSRGMWQTPLLFWVQIRGCIDAWPRLPSPLAVALCPLSQSTVSFCFFLIHAVVHFSRTLSGQHSYSFLPLSFVLLLSFLLWCICLLFFGAPSLYPWLYFKGLSLWFWSRGEWVVGWWEL